MVKHIFFIIVSLLYSVVISAGEITGTWSGALNVTPQNSLKIVFNINADAVTMDSPDQNAYGIKCDINHLSADSINIKVPQLVMDYAGRLVNDTISGVFRQGAFKVPLILTSGVKKAIRPQTPQPPFTYKTEDVIINAPDAVLAGTLTIPENSTDTTPVVVLVSGSGLQNRDEELFEHKPFAVIADYLANNGIASLRYDDRGYGESKGNNDTATTEDYAADAEAVVKYLRQTGKFSKIGIIGHSEGGLISYMIGAKPKVLDFIVSIAGPSVTGAEINAYQNKVALINTGIDPQIAEEFGCALLKALTYRLNNSPLTSVSDEMLLDIYPQYNASPVTRNLGEHISATLTKEKIQPWMEYFLRYDPASDLSRLTIPAFIIYGEKDCQVPPSLNLKPVKEKLPDSKVKVYPGLNHLMQHAISGNIDEYKNIEETISPELLSDIASFIKSLQ